MKNLIKESFLPWLGEFSAKQSNSKLNNLVAQLCGALSEVSTLDLALGLLEQYQDKIPATHSFFYPGSLALQLDKWSIDLKKRKEAHPIAVNILKELPIQQGQVNDLIQFIRDFFYRSDCLLHPVALSLLNAVNNPKFESSLLFLSELSLSNPSEHTYDGFMSMSASESLHTNLLALLRDNSAKCQEVLKVTGTWPMVYYS